MLSKVCSCLLVFALVFVGLGFVSFDGSSPDRKFSEMTEPFFNFISEVSDAARSVFDFFVSGDTNVPSEEPVPVSSGYDYTPDKYLYSCYIKTHGSWHFCYLLRTYNSRGQGGRLVFVVVFDESSSHSLEGWTCTGSFLDSTKTIVPILYSLGFAFPQRLVKDWSISGYTYSTLQAIYPNHPLYSNVDLDGGSSSGGSSGGGSSGPETSGGPGEPGWDEGGQVT